MLVVRFAVSLLLILGTLIHPALADETPTTLLPEGLRKLIQKAVPLSPDQTLFLDKPNKSLYLRTIVALDAGLLEMLCCRTQTKEHESILATDCQAFLVHTGLIALGAEPGQPVQFDPEFQPPRGEKLELTVHWIDEEGKSRQQNAKEWIQTVTRRYFVEPLAQLPASVKIPEDSELKYDGVRRELLYFGTMTKEQQQQLKSLSADPAYGTAIEKLYATSQPSPLEADWVFAGSLMRKDPNTGEEYYMAEGGDLICVANFPTATIDIAIRSSASDGNRGYEAKTSAVPAPGTPVLLQIRRTADIKPAAQ